MGRKKLNTDVSDEVRGMELMAKDNQERQLSIAEIDKACLPDGEEYNLYVSMSRAKDAIGRMATSLLDTGKELTLIKAHNPEQYEVACEKLNLSRTAALYALSAWRKFGMSTRVDAFANLGASKLRALTVLEDEDIKALDKGEILPELGSIDDIAQMSKRETQEALRKLRSERKKEREDLEAVIASKNSKIDELERELRYQDPPTQEQKARATLESLNREFFAPLCSALEDCRRVTAAVDKATAVEGATPAMIGTWCDKFSDYVSELDDVFNDMMEAINTANSVRE